LTNNIFLCIILVDVEQIISIRTNLESWRHWWNSTLFLKNGIWESMSCALSQL